jgi:hypothetical protein
MALSQSEASIAAYRFRVSEYEEEMFGSYANAGKNLRMRLRSGGDEHTCLEAPGPKRRPVFSDDCGYPLITVIYIGQIAAVGADNMHRIFGALE